MNDDDKQRGALRQDGGRIAEPGEVLGYLTDVLRGEAGDEMKTATARMRAAELLGKKLGIFDEAEGKTAERAVIIDDVGGRTKKPKKKTTAAGEREG